jgi:glucokinase
VARLAQAAEGDDLARELLTRAATYLGLAVANAVDNWDPELVVLSGPVIREGGDLFEKLLAEEQRTVLETGRARVRITRAVLDEHAKIIGAATLVMAEALATPFTG